MVENGPKPELARLSTDPWIVEEELEEASQMLSGIWFRDTLSPNPEKRRERLEEFNDSLSPEVQSLLEEPMGIGKDGRPITRGQLIRQHAIELAQEEIRQRQKNRKRERAVMPDVQRSGKLSAGERRHRRRIKAKQRGTNPGDIH